LRVVTLNVNGIRSAARKGLFRWLAAQRADVVCLQEMKCRRRPRRQAARPEGVRGLPRLRPEEGYSGVALYSRRAPDEVKRGFESREFDAEGRYVEARFGTLWVVSLYLPSGSAGAHRQKSKFRFLKVFLKHLMKLRQRGCEIILCGDWNIAHQEIDLRNWRSNQKNSGFLPRGARLAHRRIRRAGLCRCFRRLNQQPGQYTWWSNRGQAWAKNVGWRIDYQIATPGSPPPRAGNRSTRRSAFPTTRR